jgi:hypothetical protein
MHTCLRTCVALGVAALLASPLRAQCPSWQSGFALPGMNQVVNALTVFDDGTGPALYAGGGFDLADGVSARSIARWNGTTWSELGLGAGIIGSVNALAVFDDGSGAALYAGGNFTSAGGVSANSIAKWNGTSWSALGGGIAGTVLSLTVFDDGSGLALFAGGTFTSAGGTSASNLAKWNGTSWSALVAGTNDSVFSLCVFDGGSGPALYAGGLFTTAGGFVVNRIARWDGASFSSLGIGTVDGAVFALTVFDDGSGSSLYAGGDFNAAGGVAALHIARWNGTIWSSAGSLPPVASFAAHDDGTGLALYASTKSTNAGGPASVQRWSGSAWTMVGTSFDLYDPNANLFNDVRALAVLDTGAGARLYAGGSFHRIDEVGTYFITVREGSNWTVVGHSAGLGTPFSSVLSTASAAEVFDDGTGPALYVGGTFKTAGDVGARHIARWDGMHWSALGTGTDGPVRALTVFDDGSGPALYVGGEFRSAGGVFARDVAKWDGSQWSAVGFGMNAAVRALCVFDDGSGAALYAGGNFSFADNLPAACIARWTGTTWISLNSGLLPPSQEVRSMTVFDDGGGPALIVAGKFFSGGVRNLRNLASWNGTTWSSVGGGTDEAVNAVTVFDDGSGLALFAGGLFHVVQGMVVNHIARWNGATWSALGGGLPLVAGNAMSVFDDGTGPALFVGTSADGPGINDPVVGVQKWNGSGWSVISPPVPTGSFGATIAGFAAFASTPTAPADLYAVGNFLRIGDAATGTASTSIALWKGCGNVGQSVCLGDGTGAACPCANYGLPGHGCRNSATIRGAELTASGSASLAFDTLALQSEFEPHNVTSVFLQGNHLIAPVFFGDGLRCAGGALKRLYVLNANASGTVAAPIAGAPSISQRSSALGDPIDAGNSRVYQVYYRDSNLAFCPEPMGSSFNVSNGVKLLWLP